jgi:hypothetical protein
MTNTIDKVAAEPAEQEPAGLAIDEIEGEQRQRLRTADDREKPQRRLTGSTRSCSRYSPKG